jgi:hypothetical protein
MGERTCANCHYYAPGDSWPSYERSGTCNLINGSGNPAKVAVRIKPAGNAWLEVRDTFACSEHVPKATRP